MCVAKNKSERKNKYEIECTVNGAEHSCMLKNCIALLVDCVHVDKDKETGYAV